MRNLLLFNTVALNLLNIHVINLIEAPFRHFPKMKNGLSGRLFATYNYILKTVKLFSEDEFVTFQKQEFSSPKSAKQFVRTWKETILKNKYLKFCEHKSRYLGLWTY